MMYMINWFFGSINLLYIYIFYLLASLSANLFLASLISLYVIFVYLSSAHIVSGLNFSLCPSAHVLSDTSFNVRPYIINIKNTLLYDETYNTSRY